MSAEGKMLNQVIWSVQQLLMGENRPEQHVCALRKGKGKGETEGRRCVWCMSVCAETER